MTIPFLKNPVQEKERHLVKLDETEKELVKIYLRLYKKIDNQQWISNIFLRPKQNCIFRMILDLIELNKIVKYEISRLNQTGYLDG